MNNGQWARYASLIAHCSLFQGTGPLALTVYVNLNTKMLELAKMQLLKESLPTHPSARDVKEPNHGSFRIVPGADRCRSRHQFDFTAFAPEVLHRFI